MAAEGHDLRGEQSPQAASAGARAKARLPLRQTGLIVLVIVTVSALGGVLGALGSQGGGTKARRAPAVRAQPAVDASLAGPGLAALMGISRLPGTRAPSFSLTDQEGVATSLAKLRGKVLVLAFLDDRCGPLCPVLPEELRGAASGLGRAAGRVVFAAVNVDAARNTPRDLLSFSVDYGLSSIRSWLFLTGSAARLSAVWRAYGVSVDKGPTGIVAYTGAIYFITAKGDEAYEASPYANEQANGTGSLPASSIREWSSGIAAYARRLLVAAGTR